MKKNNIQALLKAVERQQEMELQVTRVKVGTGTVYITLPDPPRTVTVSVNCYEKIKDRLVRREDKT